MRVGRKFRFSVMHSQNAYSYTHQTDRYSKIDLSFVSSSSLQIIYFSSRLKVFYYYDFHVDLGQGYENNHNNIPLIHSNVQYSFSYSTGNFIFFCYQGGSIFLLVRINGNVGSRMLELLDRVIFYSSTKNKAAFLKISLVNEFNGR